MSAGPKAAREARRRLARKVVTLHASGLSSKGVADMSRLRKKTVRRILDAAGIGGEVDSSVVDGHDENGDAVVVGDHRLRSRLGKPYER